MAYAPKKKIKVIAYSGYTSDERPLHIVMDGKSIEVKHIEKRWRDQEGDFFKIIGKDGCGYLLQRNRDSGNWFLILEPLKG